MLTAAPNKIFKSQNLFEEINGPQKYQFDAILDKGLFFFKYRENSGLFAGWSAVHFG